MVHSALVTRRHGPLHRAAARRSSDTTFQEEYLAFLRKHGAHSDEKYFWDQLRPTIPYPTGRFFRGTLSQALRARLRSVLSLRDALADISQLHLAINQVESQFRYQLSRSNMKRRLCHGSPGRQAMIRRALPASDRLTKAARHLGK